MFQQSRRVQRCPNIHQIEVFQPSRRRQQVCTWLWLLEKPKEAARNLLGESTNDQKQVSPHPHNVAAPLEFFQRAMVGSFPLGPGQPQSCSSPSGKQLNTPEIFFGLFFFVFFPLGFFFLLLPGFPSSSIFGIIESKNRSQS